MKVLGTNSMIQCVFTVISILMSIDVILNTILVPGILLAGFLSLRLFSYLQHKIVYNITMGKVLKYSLLGTLGLGIVAT